MVSKTVPMGIKGIKESSINSTRMLNIIATNQAGVMNLIIDAKLKQNSNLFVHNLDRAFHPQEKSPRRHICSTIMDKESGRDCFFVVRRL
jgi:hypothetical protein